MPKRSYFQYLEKCGTTTFITIDLQRHRPLSSNLPRLTLGWLYVRLKQLQRFSTLLLSYRPCCHVQMRPVLAREFDVLGNEFLELCHRLEYNGHSTRVCDMDIANNISCLFEMQQFDEAAELVANKQYEQVILGDRNFERLSRSEVEKRSFKVYEIDPNLYEERPPSVTDQSPSNREWMKIKQAATDGRNMYVDAMTLMLSHKSIHFRVPVEPESTPRRRKRRMRKILQHPGTYKDDRFGRLHDSMPDPIKLGVLLASDSYHDALQRAADLVIRHPDIASHYSRARVKYVSFLITPRQSHDLDDPGYNISASVTAYETDYPPLRNSCERGYETQSDSYSDESEAKRGGCDTPAESSGDDSSSTPSEDE